MFGKAAIARKEARLERNAEVIDALHAAEATVAKSAKGIADLEARVTTLQQEHAELRADAVEGKTTLDQAATKRIELEAARADLKDLNEAHSVLVGRLEAAKRAAAQNARDDIKRALNRKLAKRLELARQIEELEKERGRLWHAMHTVAEEISIVYPGGMVPAGGMTDNNSLRIAFERESYRQNANPPLYGGQPHLGVPTIPGAKCPDIRLLGVPDKLPPMTRVIEDANTFLLTMLDRG